MPKVLLLIVALAQLIAIGNNHPKLNAEQQLKVLRLQIVRTVRIVEDAHQKGILTSEEYTRCQTDVIRAARIYNSVLKGYVASKTLDRSQYELIVTTLAGAVRAAKGK